MERYFFLNAVFSITSAKQISTSLARKSKSTVCISTRRSTCRCNTILTTTPCNLTRVLTYPFAVPQFLLIAPQKPLLLRVCTFVLFTGTTRVWTMFFDFVFVSGLTSTFCFRWFTQKPGTRSFLVLSIGIDLFLKLDSGVFAYVIICRRRIC